VNDLENCLECEMQNKRCAGFGFFYDDIVRLPPLHSYPVRVKYLGKGTPCFVGLEDEVMDAMEVCEWDELSDEALENLLAELRLKAGVGDEAFKDFEELVDQSAPPVTFFDKIRLMIGRIG